MKSQLDEAAADMCTVSNAEVPAIGKESEINGGSSSVARINKFGRVFRKRLLCILAVAGLLPAYMVGSDFTSDEVAMLQDPAGWEYISITDAGNGFETKHGCFDPGVKSLCTGKLLLNKDGSFSQSVTVHGKSLNRHGTYQLAARQIIFKDELGTADAPYSLDLRTDSKFLLMQTTQAGVTLRVELKLKKELRKRSHPPVAALKRKQSRSLIFGSFSSRTATNRECLRWKIYASYCTSSWA
jgi:hypothetical protein